MLNFEIPPYHTGRRTGQRRSSQSGAEPHQQQLQYQANGAGGGGGGGGLGRRRSSAGGAENGNYMGGDVELHDNSNDVWEALVAMREARLRRETDREFHLQVERRDNQWMPRQNSGVSINVPRASHTVIALYYTPLSVDYWRMV